MSARDRILGRVRGAVTGQGDRAAAVAARLAQHPAGPVPAQATSRGDYGSPRSEKNPATPEAGNGPARHCTGASSRVCMGLLKPVTFLQGPMCALSFAFP
jgi:hypothetical protein